MNRVVVYGSTGHTGRFVLTELRERGFDAIPSGRQVATVDDPEGLDRALAGAAAVVNCAGPFAVTAGPLVAAARRAGIPYLDIAAEIEAIGARFSDGTATATPVVPAMAFYGGLGDLLVTAAMGDWTAADEALIAYGLSGWHPTAGTRLAGQVSHRRRAGRRVRFTRGELRYHDDPPVPEEWPFPEPLGRRAVIAEFSMADIVTVPSHLAIPEVRTCMAAEAARDLAAADTPPPAGRSDQTFMVDVLVRADGTERRATARGRDIYAVTAPLVAEAVTRVLDGRTRASGVASAGAMFDADDFLRSLEKSGAVLRDR